MVRGAPRRWLAAGLAMAVGAGGLTFALRDETTSKAQAAGAPAPIDVPASGLIVHLTGLASVGGQAPAGVPMSLTVEATGVAPIGVLEVWAGAELVASHQPGTVEAASLTEQLEWTPEETGPVLLTARAVDRDGRSAQSTPVRAEIVELADPLPWVTERADGTETLAEFADRVGVAPADLLLADPDLPETGPLPAGTALDLPQWEPDLPEAGAAIVPEELKGLLAEGTTGGGAGRRAPVPSAPDPRPGAAPAPVPGGDLLAVAIPDLTVAIGDDCTATTTVANAADAEKVVIEMLAPTAPAFTPIAVVDPTTEEEVTTPVGPGPIAFVATATDGDASAISTPVFVTGPGECEGTWTGDVKLVNGRLSGGQPADVAYLYLSTAPGDWVRVPSESGSFVPAGPDGTFSFVGHLPPMTGTTLRLEAWGWSQGVLMKIGSATFTPTAGMSLSEVIGAIGTVSLQHVWAPAEAGGEETLGTEAYVGDTPGDLTFRWATSLPGVTHGVWQVTTFPPDPSGPLDPVGVVAQGTVDGDGGDFEIDFGAITGQPQTLSIGDQPLAYSAAVASFGQSGPTAGSAGDEIATPPTGGSSGVDTAMAIPADVLANLDLPEATQFYVRVLPFSKDHYKGMTSNRVRIDTNPLLSPELAKAMAELAEQEAKKRPYEVDFSFTPPQAPDLSKVACWKFTDWDPGKGDAEAVKLAASTLPDLALASNVEALTWRKYLKVYSAYGYGVSICPGVCYSEVGVSFGGKCGGGFDPIGDLVGAVWAVGTTLWDKVIVGTFTAVKDFAVNTLADACALFGDQLLGEGQSGNECNVLAEVAVDAALIALGIPPTLPTTSQAIQGLKGDLKAVMVELATDLGVPCDEIATGSAAAGKPEYSCEGIADVLVEELDDQIQAALKQQAKAVSGLYIPEGMKMVPDPAGQITPSRFDVTVTPTSKAPPDGKTCTATAAITSSWFTGPASSLSGNAWVSVSGLSGQMMHTPSGKVGTVKAATLPPRFFHNPPFIATSWQLPDTKSSLLPILLPATASFQLYQPAAYDPVPVSLAIQDPGGFTGGGGTQGATTVYKPGQVPYHSFLLQPTASHHALLYGECFGFVAAETPTIDLADPVGVPVSGED